MKFLPPRRSIMRAPNKTLAYFLATAVGCFVMVANDSTSSGSTNFVQSAEARVGRPLTPMSYAGVARRTTRRAVAVGAATTGAAYYSRCTSVVNSYGQVVRRCY